MKYRPLFLAAILTTVVAVFVAFYVTRPTPLYTQIVFGPNESTRLWFIARGLHLYMDRDASDGVQPTEYLGKVKAKLPLDITTSDGKTVYQNISISLLLVPEAVSDDRPQELVVDVDINGMARFSQYGFANMVDHPGLAATLHVDGPLKMRLREHGLPCRLIANGEPTDVCVDVSTIDPDGRGGMMVYSSDRRDRSVRAFPEDVTPVLEVAFPSKVPGSSPIRQRFTLDEFC